MWEKTMAMELDRHRYAVIMAGGVGSRLWPLSRKGSPKQTLNLFRERTLFQLAVDRLLSLLPPDRILVVTTQAQVATLARQYPDLPAQNFIVEPMGRGTAPCIGLAALHIQQRDPDGLMAVVAADHCIRDVPAFCAVLKAAYVVADKGYLVTLGITPTFPSTGYGYIRVGEKLGEVHGAVYFRANAFIEKPNLARAKAFLAAGDRVWNSGMFVWRTDRILEEMSLWMPELHRALMRIQPTLGHPEHDAVLRESWASLEKQTIDYGIMEHAERVAVIPASIEWSDVG
ncbi:MAG TPA: mannose-1-phosphate guanylyltransferase, partial [Chloroflexi bacterium]|nr:mannose-1-phosphate guanylyltransferase [Chloroflexota bacterium]